MPSDFHCDIVTITITVTSNCLLFLCATILLLIRFVLMLNLIWRIRVSIVIRLCTLLLVSIRLNLSELWDPKSRFFAGSIEDGSAPGWHRYYGGPILPAPQGDTALALHSHHTPSIPDSLIQPSSLPTCTIFLRQTVHS